MYAAAESFERDGKLVFANRIDSSLVCKGLKRVTLSCK